MSSGSDLVHAESVEVRRFIFSVMQSVLIRRCVGFFGNLHEQTEIGQSDKNLMRSYFLKQNNLEEEKRHREYLLIHGFSGDRGAS